MTAKRLNRKAQSYRSDRRASARLAVLRTVCPLATLLSKRTSPERLYLESKFASLMSYGLTVKLLEEILPLEGKLNAASVRNNLHEVAQKVEAELGEEEYIFADGCEQEWSKLPRPDLPITVGIDGGYIHSCSPKKKAKEWFEVIVGKSITDAGDTKCFGGVTSYDQKPKRRLFEVLKSQGMQMNQQVTFLSDGGENIRELQLYLNRLKNGVSSTHPLRGIELRALRQLQRKYPDSNYLFVSERGAVMAAAQGLCPVRRLRRLAKLCFARERNYPTCGEDGGIVFERSSPYAAPCLWLLSGKSRA